MNNLIINRKGSALLIALALMAMLTGVAIMSVDRSTTDIELSYNQLHEDKAFYAAEAGLARAMMEINRDFSWREAILDSLQESSKYAVIILDSTWGSTLADTVIVRATGQHSQAAVNLEAWLAPIIVSPFRYAAFGDDSLVMRNTACTDSYNSDSGSYSITADTSGGDVGSNGYIKMFNNATVYGNAGTATEGGISNDNLSRVSGDTTTNAPPTDMNIVSDDDYSYASSNNSAPSGFSGSYTYDPFTNALNVGIDDTLQLSSGVYYFSNIALNQGAVIQPAPGADVEIYMTGDLTVNQYSAINPDGVPADMIIYSKGSQLTIGQSVEFRAVFWGPSTSIRIEQNTNVYGSLMGKSMRIANSACVHFDRSLLKTKTKKIDKMEVVAWRRI